MPIPFQLLQASLLSQLVLLATDGEVQESRGSAGGSPAGTAGLSPWGGSGTLKMKNVRRKSGRGIQEFAELSFYQSYLRLPLEKLYHSCVGEDLEHFTNDFDTVMEKRFEKFPSLVAAVAEVLIFGGYLFFLNPMMAVPLLAIGMVQIVPPLICQKSICRLVMKAAGISRRRSQISSSRLLPGPSEQIRISQCGQNGGSTRLEKLYARYRRIGKESSLCFKWRNGAV